MGILIQVPKEAILQVKRSYKIYAPDLKYPKTFEAEDKINLRFLIEEVPEVFITLYGVSIGLNNGSIALGMFPRSEIYVKAYDIKRVLYKVLFNNVRYNIDLDIRYILNLLKINDVVYEKDIIEYIKGKLEEKEEADGPKSISLRYIREMNKKTKYSKEGNYFFELCEKGEVLSKIREGIIFYAQTFNTLFNDLFGANLNHEELINILYDYSKCGLHPIILNEIISRRRYLGYTLKTTSSLLKGDEKDETHLAYNFMNIARAAGWEQNVIFGLESIVSYNTTKVIEKVLSKFNIQDILDDLGYSLPEFIKGIDKYRKEFIPIEDVYIKFSEYANPINVSKQVYEFAKVLDSSMSMIQKSINSEE